MKTHSKSAPRSQVRPSICAISLLLGVALFGFVAHLARAQVNEVQFGVRSEVKDKSFDVSMMKEADRHGKTYGILAVQLISSDLKLVKPVDARGLMGLVCHELDSHGFTQVAKGGKPDILITVQYGRAWLRNPYYGDTQVTYIPGGPDGGAGATRNLTMADAKTFARLKEPGIEAKAQVAELEKLCIKLTAWEYLTDPKAKSHQVWNTTMIVDDPDHRDLNAIAAEMLATGSPYFGKQIKEEQLDINKPLPNGHVNVGTPEVVDRPKSK
jgi:hypothetical protein